MKRHKKYVRGKEPVTLSISSTISEMIPGRTFDVYIGFKRFADAESFQDVLRDFLVGLWQFHVSEPVSFGGVAQTAALARERDPFGGDETDMGEGSTVGLG